MLEIFDFVRSGSIDMLTVAIRLALAVLCGGFIGIERERKRRPAGFRTHILICLGAAMATLTSQYIALELNMYTDMARLGAQVIAGIGFIGAGTIIVTKRRQVKGLTTAAGLWTAAIVGLCCGAGFVEAALLATVIIMVVELLLVKIEYFVVSTAKTVNLYVEYESVEVFAGIKSIIEDKNAKILQIELAKTKGEGRSRLSVILSMQFNGKSTFEEITTELARLEGIYSVQEL